jgi:FkbM family methyltransferase
MDNKGLRRTLIARPLIAVIGRRNVYRLSRFLIEESRRDQSEDIGSNGERLVQATVLKWSAHPVVFDVGANVGNWTASLFELAGKNRRGIVVHAFEPCGSTFRQLTERLQRERWKDVILVPSGLSAAPGEGQMMVKFDGCSGNGIVESEEEQAFVLENAAESREILQSARIETINLTSVDVYSTERSLGYIDLVKSDAEGHDFAVILGARDMLKRRAIGVLQFEYNMRWIGACRYLRDVFALVRPFGYVVGKITPQGIEFYQEWRWEMETYRGMNYIACTPQWAARFKYLAPTWLEGLGQGRVRPWAENPANS